MKNIIFGQKSEKYIIADQYTLFEMVAESQETEGKKDFVAEVDPKKKTNKRGKAISLPKDIEEKIVTIEPKNIEELDRLKAEFIGASELRLLARVPARNYIIREIRPRYKHPDGNIIEAPAPNRILPKTPIDDSVIADMLVKKVLDRNPFYHQEKSDLLRHGINISRSKRSSWMIYLAQEFKPLARLINDTIYDYDIASMDATSLQVLKTKNKKPTQKSEIWIYTGGEPGKESTYYNYVDDKSRVSLNDTFAGYKGYISCDDDPEYKYLQGDDNLKLSKCHAHVRRYFKEVNGSPGSVSDQVMRLYKKIYMLERDYKDLASSDRKDKRIKNIKPLLMEMKDLIDSKIMTIDPKTPLSKAANYLLRNWTGLILFLEDGRLPIDNNHTEREVKDFVMARKNFMFSNSTRGADALAVWFSILMTAKKHIKNPYDYLIKIFSIYREKKRGEHTFEDFERMLPWNLDAP